MDKDMAVGLADGSRSERSERSEPSGTEVPVVVRRRRRTTEYKLRVLAQADGCVRPGELMALARREGLYASTISERENKRLQLKLKRAEGLLEIQKKPRSCWKA